MWPLTSLLKQLNKMYFNVSLICNYYNKYKSLISKWRRTEGNLLCFCDLQHVVPELFLAFTHTSSDVAVVNNRDQTHWLGRRNKSPSLQRLWLQRVCLLTSLCSACVTTEQEHHAVSTILDKQVIKTKIPAVSLVVCGTLKICLCICGVTAEHPPRPKQGKLSSFEVFYFFISCLCVIFIWFDITLFMSGLIHH